MALVSGGGTESEWDDVMFHLAKWLLRHLDDPALLIWAAQHGGRLHDRWQWLIEAELERLDRLQVKDDQRELEEIRAHAPNAIPRPFMRTLWRIFLVGRVKTPRGVRDLFGWTDRLKRDGLTTTLRLELRDLLTPQIVLRKPFRWDMEEEPSAEPTRIKQLVDWELVLVADHVHSSLGNRSDERWRLALPVLLDDLQQLLRDALDLLKELGAADERRDHLHWDLPSISPHSQNKDFRDWIILVELLRDAWLATWDGAPVRARQIAITWFELPYVTFKRLALFAAAQDNCINPTQWTEWLLSDEAWWLWSVETRRETMRLIVLQGAQLTPSDREALEIAILLGPPRRMYQEGLEQEEWQRLTRYSIWLHLASHQGAGVLGVDAPLQFNRLSDEHQNWKLSRNEQEEFSLFTKLWTPTREIPPHGRVLLAGN